MTGAGMASIGGRIDYLDGLRGVAILSVLLYHYCGPTYAAILGCDGGIFAPLIARGWVGVQLFFLISGFVILMTLEKRRAFGPFLYHRWLRLFPAMLITTITLVVFNAATDIPGPHPMRSVLDVIPGLIFVSPSILHAVMHLDIQSLDGVFWTLYTEMGFYVVFGALYFVAGWRVAVCAIVILAVVTSTGDAIMATMGVSHGLRRAIEPLGWMNMHLYGWFASGALFYKARQSKSAALFNAAFLLGIATAMTQTNFIPLQWIDRAILILVVILFSTAQVSRPLQAALSSRIAMFFGSISYALYLLHNEIGVSLIGWGNMTLGRVPPFLVVVSVAAGAVAAAWGVTRYAEPAVRSLIKHGAHTVSSARMRKRAAIEI
jgi:peptidoglycan/LPS O-acetylase OafA/YrhL